MTLIWDNVWNFLNFWMHFDTSSKFKNLLLNWIAILLFNPFNSQTILLFMEIIFIGIATWNKMEQKNSMWLNVKLQLHAFHKPSIPRDVLLMQPHTGQPGFSSDYWLNFKLLNLIYLFFSPAFWLCSLCGASENLSIWSCSLPTLCVNFVFKFGMMRGRRRRNSNKN